MFNSQMRLPCNDPNTGQVFTFFFSKKQGGPIYSVFFAFQSFMGGTRHYAPSPKSEFLDNISSVYLNRIEKPVVKGQKL